MALNKKKMISKKNVKLNTYTEEKNGYKSLLFDDFLKL
jgi:hypothetical protein